MTTTQALYVLEVAACRSMSRAAQRLYVSQSAISQQIQKLEQELGCALFTRTVTGLELTAAGENFCHQARPVIDAWQKLCQDLNADNATAKKQLRIGLGSRVYSNSLFQDIVRDIRREGDDGLALLVGNGGALHAVQRFLVRQARRGLHDQRAQPVRLVTFQHRLHLRG